MRNRRSIAIVRAVVKNDVGYQEKLRQEADDIAAQEAAAAEKGEVPKLAQPKFVTEIRDQMLSASVPFRVAVKKQHRVDVTKSVDVTTDFLTALEEVQRVQMANLRAELMLVRVSSLAFHSHAFRHSRLNLTRFIIRVSFSRVSFSRVSFLRSTLRVRLCASRAIDPLFVVLVVELVVAVVLVLLALLAFVTVDLLVVPVATVATVLSTPSLSRRWWGRRCRRCRCCRYHHDHHRRCQRRRRRHRHRRRHHNHDHHRRRRRRRRRPCACVSCCLLVTTFRRKWTR
jgi:hypothetical protein